AITRGVVPKPHCPNISLRNHPGAPLFDGPPLLTQEGSRTTCPFDFPGTIPIIMKIKGLLLLVLMVSLRAATTQPAEDRGAMGLAQALNRLDVVGSVLHTGAHPDDENSGLLSW